MTEAYMNNAQLKLSEFDALSEVSLRPGLIISDKMHNRSLQMTLIAMQNFKPVHAFNEIHCFMSLTINIYSDRQQNNSHSTSKQVRNNKEH